MRKTSVRIWITAGLAVIALATIGYTLLLKRMEPSQQEELKMTEAPQNDADRGAEPIGQIHSVKVAKAATTKESVSAEAGSQRDEKNLLAVGHSALNNPDGRERAMIASMLRHAESEEAVDLLYQFLDDEDKLVIFHALNSLCLIGIKNSNLKSKVYDILLEKAKDKECPERGNALLFATQVGKDDKILNVISDYIGEDDQGETSKRFAVKALAGIANPDCIDYLQEILITSTSPEIHHIALNTLSMIDDEAAAIILEEKLYTSNTQTSAAMALAQWGKPEYNQILSKAIVCGSLNEEAIAIVAQYSAGPSVLKEFVENNTFSEEETLSLLKIYTEGVLRARGEVRSDTAKAVLPLLESPDRDIQLQAIKILGCGTWEQRDMADMLAPKLKSPEREIRFEALKSYHVYLTPDDYKPVLDMIWDEDETIRRYALGFTENFIDGSDRAILAKALNHEDEAIRKRVSEILN
jgi:HEAT repeat protein